jgi:type IV pilus assembly protein PilB
MNATSPMSQTKQAHAPTAGPPQAPPRRIGDILIEEGLISSAQLGQALSESRATGQPIGSVLVKLGLVQDDDLGRCLAKLHGLRYVDADHVEIHEDLISLLSEDFMRRNLLVPIRVDKEANRLEVAVARPDNLRILDEVSLITGMRVIPRVSTHSQLMRLLDRLLTKFASSDQALAEAEEELSQDDVYNLNAASELEAEMAAEDAPIVRLVNAILVEAIEMNASDIHIEPQKERLLIRFRIDGILREVKSIPKKMVHAVVSRIKVVSGMDIAERRRPQDGRMKLVFGSQQVDMRVNSLAIQFGEKVVIRLLKPNATTGGLEKLGLSDHEIKPIHKMIHAPHGIILVTGPTGSGKTTTLYSALREINTPERNISTVEDPIEYPLAGINQTQVSHKSGLTFSTALRALLRQDPDVIMIGEIRDEETLEAAIHASLTGHLVFSTLHTNSTAKTIARLLEMGAPNYLVSTSVIGIVAQRLVRRICGNCKTKVEATDQEKETLGISKQRTIHLHRGAGCDKCGGTGYSGRVGLYEILEMNHEIEKLIDAGGSASAIQAAAVKTGMYTLGMDGKRKIAQGLTTVEEVTRVLGLDLDG